MEPFEELEQRWAKWNKLDPRGMVSCSSGTAALHLALECFNLPADSEGITSDLNMVAVPRAIRMANLRPTFVDCDSNLLMDCKLASNAVTYKTSAIIATHIYGRDINLSKLSVSNKLILIEDIAEAHGLEPYPRTDAACWSFYKNKTIFGEEGGAVWFKDFTRAAMARSLRSLGFTEKHDMMHVARGHNYRMSNAHAKLVLTTLQNYDDTVRYDTERYYDSFCPDAFKTPFHKYPWVYDIRIKGLDYVTQDKIISELKNTGIQARHCFKPMSMQPEFDRVSKLSLKAYDASREVIYLPLRPKLDADMLKKAFDTLKHFTEKLCR